MKHYAEGRAIQTLEELLNQKMVMFHGKPLNISIVKNWQLGYVLYQLNNGFIKCAEKENW